MNEERRVRRHVYGALHRAIVTSASGLVEALAEELRELEGALLAPGDRGFALARSEGHIELSQVGYRTLLELTLRLTLAHDLRLQIASGRVASRTELDALLRRTPWALYLPGGARVAVKADSRGSRLYHEGLIEEHAAAALAAAGFAVERPRVAGAPVPGPAAGPPPSATRRDTEPGGAGPQARAGVPDRGEPQHVLIRVEANRASVELSLAGRPLWQRGYRASFETSAPLREDLAQAAVRAALAFAGPQDGPAVEGLLLPFAGSGTLLFESLIALFRIPPALFRRSYSFEQLAFGAPPSIAWLKRRLSEATARRFAASARLQAVLIDSHPPALDSARANLRSFAEQLSGLGAPPFEVTLLDGDVFAKPWATYLPSGVSSLLLPLNPPYGRRMPVASLSRSFRRIGESVERLATDLRAAAFPRAAARSAPPVSRTVRPSGSGGRLVGFILCPTEAAWKEFLAATPSLHKSTAHFGQGGLDIRLCAFSSGGER